MATGMFFTAPTWFPSRPFWVSSPEVNLRLPSPQLAFHAPLETNHALHFPLSPGDLWFPPNVPTEGR